MTDPAKKEERKKVTRTHKKSKMCEIKSRRFVDVINESTGRTNYDINQALITSYTAAPKRHHNQQTLAVTLGRGHTG